MHLYYFRQTMFRQNIKYQTDKVTLSNGCNIAYIDEGQGDTTLLFVHGLAMYGHSWVLNIAYLKQYYRCIAIDLPGNGYSDNCDHTYGINFYSGCVYDFMQKLGLKNAVLVGHSMGGQICINLVANQPDAAQKLVLCAPAGLETFNGLQRSVYKGTINFLDLFSSEENSLRKVVRTSFYQYPEQTEEMLQELIGIMHDEPIGRYRKTIEECINGMLDEPVYDKLVLLEPPVLIIYGERDALIPNRLIHPITTRKLAEDAIKHIANGRLEMIPQCGHFLQLEKPSKVNHLIREFAEE